LPVQIYMVAPIFLIQSDTKENTRLDLLLEAFEIAALKNQKLKLLIAGQPASGDLHDKYVEIIKQSAVQDRINFHFNYIQANEVAEYLISSDVVILPYKNIDHSGIVHLAYSFGKPIIATNVGDFKESIEQGKSGYILNKNNAECLAEAINNIFSCEEKLEDMGRYIKHLNNSRYSWDQIGIKTMELYV